MARDHTNALKANTSRCRTLLEPVLTSIFSRLPAVREIDAPEVPLTNQDSRWESRCLVLFSQIVEWDRLIRSLFADTGVSEHAEDSLRELVAVFPHLENQVAEFETLIAGELSACPGELSLKNKQQ
jgi:hypothetical protein